jgi:uncharacterized membrane protein YbaN (DUF454 family)
MHGDRGLCPPRLSVGNVDRSPTREPRIVHSSRGRLRVHLAHWAGRGSTDLAAAVRRLPGVVHAEARAITQNVLIQFRPALTSVQALLEALPGLRVEAYVERVVRVVEMEQPQPTSNLTLPSNVQYVTGATRIVYQGLGWASVGMAVVGAITPGIPTAPFVILAGYFFIHSSRESHQWLRQSRWFGPILCDWEDHRGIRRPVRNVALALIAASMVVTLFLGLPTFLTAAIVLCQIIGILFVASLNVVEATVLRPNAQIAVA